MCLLGNISGINLHSKGQNSVCAAFKNSNLYHTYDLRKMLPLKYIDYPRPYSGARISKVSDDF